jgi:hypothetical protein
MEDDYEDNKAAYNTRRSRTTQSKPGLLFKRRIQDVGLNYSMVSKKRKGLLNAEKQARYCWGSCYAK